MDDTTHRDRTQPACIANFHGIEVIELQKMSRCRWQRQQWHRDGISSVIGIRGKRTRDRTTGHDNGVRSVALTRKLDLSCIESRANIEGMSAVTDLAFEIARTIVRFVLHDSRCRKI